MPTLACGAAHHDRRTHRRSRSTAVPPCRAITTAVFGVFAVRFFAVRKHLFTTAGLQALVDITAHPALSRYIKEITIISLTPRNPENYNLGHMSDWEAQQCCDDYEEFKTEEARFSKIGGNATQLLSKAFRNLQEAQIVPRMVVAWKPGTRLSNITGMRSLPWTFSKFFIEAWWMHGHAETVVRCAAESLLRSDLAVAELSLGERSSESWTGLQGFQIHHARLQLSKAKFNNLLKLHVDMTSYPSNSHLDVYDSLGATFVSATHLRELSLKWDIVRFFNHAPLSKLVAAFSKVKLERLRLDSVTASLNDFVIVLQAQDQLKCLVLYTCQVRASQCWSSAITCLLGHPHLESIELVALDVERDQRAVLGKLVATGRTYPDTLKISEDHDAVQGALQKLATAIEYQEIKKVSPLQFQTSRYRVEESVYQARFDGLPSW